MPMHDQTDEILNRAVESQAGEMPVCAGCGELLELLSLAWRYNTPVTEATDEVT